MRLLLTLPLVIGLLGQSALGQGAQADQIKRRAKELSNQNNVRQGVPPASQPPAKQPATPARASVAKPVAATPTTLQQQNVARLTADISAIKPGTAVAPEQKERLIKNIVTAVRGANKPSGPAVSRFVHGLAGALAGKGLGTAEQQSRLAQNVEAVLNSERLPQAQFDAIIEDVQAILQVGGAKRDMAIAVANDLKAVGAEVRKKPAK